METKIMLDIPNLDDKIMEHLKWRLDEYLWKKAKSIMDSEEGKKLIIDALKKHLESYSLFELSDKIGIIRK